MSETVRLTIPAKAEYLVLARLVLTGIAMEVPMSEIALADLKLAVTEVCGNAVLARPPGRLGRRSGRVPGRGGGDRGFRRGRRRPRRCLP